jgi:VWFA-related protein
MRTPGLPARRNPLALFPVGFTLCSLPLLAQSPPASSAPPPIVRVEVNLVQVDAVVTDRHGRQVTDLKAGDFEVLEDKKPRPIIGVNYVRNASMQPANSAAAKTTIAILVDDLNLSFESVAYLRKSLTKFVNTQLRPGDEVAILRSSSGSGAWDEFTSKRRVLLEEAGLIHWLPTLWYLPYFVDQQPPTYLSSGPPHRPTAAADWDVQSASNVFTGGTLGALRFILQGMSGIPGRKAAIVFSDSIPLATGYGSDPIVLAAFRSLTDLANRAGVVLYTVDAAGLNTFEPDAAGTGAFSTQAIADFISSTDGLVFLANQTGGMFLSQSNDLNREIAKVENDLDSYYLIGFSPAPNSLARYSPPFHTIQVRVKRRGLHVRSRRGFLGLPDSFAGPEPEPAGTRQLVQAVFSPFVRSQVPVVLTTNYTYSGNAGDVQNFLYIEPRRLRLARQPDGSRTGTLDLAVLAFRPDGSTAAHVTARAKVSLNAVQYVAALRQGIVYGFKFTLPPGATYQVRAAVLDRGSGRLGSANQVLDIPGRKKGQAALSSLEVGRIDESNPQAGAQFSRSFVTHRFRPDAWLGFRCAIFDPRTDPASRKTALIAQTRIYHDAELVYTGSPTNLAAAPNAQGSMVVSGAVRLNQAFSPGDYSLVLEVTDTLQPKTKNRTRLAWTDFAIRPPRGDAAVTIPQH